MELVDVVDSKSTAGDSVPVRVRPPAPINPIVNVSFTMGFILCTGWTRTGGESLGSDPTAAGGGVKGGERVAAVDKIEDQRKPEDFIALPQTGGEAEDAAYFEPCHPDHLPLESWIHGSRGFLFFMIEI